MSLAADRGPPRVRVLVVNHNSGPWLRRCLDSLRAQTMTDFEAVVIDNASSDDSFPAVAPDVRFTLVAHAENLGFAAANNLAALGARTPWLALLNPDAIAEPDWLERLLEEAQAHADFGVFGSVQLRAGDPAILDGTGDCLSAFGMAWRSGFGHPVGARLPEGPVFAACAAALMIRREVFEQLGGFEPRYFCYVEDVDLCFRARLRGVGVWQSARARVHHAGGACAGGGETSFAMYHGYRNSIWLLLRCMPMPWLLVALPGLVLSMFLRALRPRKSGQRMALWRGVRDGLIALPGILPERREIARSRRVSRFEVGSWLSWSLADTVRRRCVVLSPPKKTPGHEAGRGL